MNRRTPSSLWVYKRLKQTRLSRLIYLEGGCGDPQKVGHHVSNQQMGVDCVAQTAQIPVKRYNSTFKSSRRRCLHTHAHYIYSRDHRRHQHSCTVLEECNLMQLNYTLYEYCWCCCWRSAQYTIDIKCCIFLPSHCGSGQSAAPADALPTHSTHSTHITVQVYCQRPSEFIILGYTATSIWCALLYTSRKNEIQLFIHHRITDLLLAPVLPTCPA